jgi:thiol-disulfide isomerase/thioredoxin
MHLVLAVTLLLAPFRETWLLQTLPDISRELYGIQAPDIHARSIDGKEYGLASFRGRYILLDFWAIGCGPCRDALPALEAVHHDYKNRGFVILGIDVGEERLTVETFLKKTPAPYPIVLDKDWDIAKLFHVNVIPTYILIDPDGKIVDGHVGFLKAGPNSKESIGESQLRGMLQRIGESNLGK